MSKNMLIFFAIVVITIVFIYGFSASYTSDSVDNISYVRKTKEMSFDMKPFEIKTLKIELTQ